MYVYVLHSLLCVYGVMFGRIPLVATFFLNGVCAMYDAVVCQACSVIHQE